jgi:hypothetical protein
LGEEKMKKLAISLIVGASLAIAPSVFALTSMSADSMKAATGQAGVSIAVDNVVIEQFTGSTSYTDEDGTMGTGGSIVISDKHVVKTYLAMTSETDYEDDFLAAAGVANLGTWDKARALTIDVGDCTVLAAGLNDNIANLTAAEGTAITTAVTAMVTAITGGTDRAEALNDAAMTLIANGTAEDIGEAKIFILSAASPAAVETVTGVVIGLPTLLISTTADNYTVGVAKTGAVNNGADFISIAKGASAMAILGGTIEIAAH